MQSTQDILERRRQLVGDHVMELLVDGDCPLCRREADLLRRVDMRGRLKLVDISEGEGAAAARGLSQAAVMGHIHGILRDGRVVTGVEAFIHAYEAAGLPWLSKLLRAPGARPVAERAYALFARYRLRLTGRAGVDVCSEGRCAVP